MLGTLDDDFRPAAGSPAIDAGNSDDLPLDLLDLDADGILDEYLPIDLLRRPRQTDTIIVPDTGISSDGSPVVDLGPYEVDACQDCPGERTWQSPAGGMYAEPINWFPGVAGAGNTAVFDLPLTDPVIFDDDVTNFALRVRGQADATLNLAGNTYTLTAMNENPFIAGESAIPGGFPSDFPATRPTSVASLTLLNGMVSSETAVLGLEPLSAGSLTLRSTPTEFADWIISDDIVIGDRGYGELRLEGGSMLFSLAATIGSQPGSFGAVTLEDPATEWVSAFGVSVERGNLHVGAGATVTPTTSGFGQILLFQDGTLTGDGTINGDVVNFGVVEPMPSSGVRGELSNLNIQGDYRQFGTIPQAGGSGTLRIQIDSSGVPAGLTIDGRAILAGGLVVDTNPEAGMFDPAVNDSFEILTAGLGLGESDGSRFRFDAILAPGLPGGKFFRLDDSAKRGPNGSIALKVSTLGEMDVEIETQTPTEITGGKPTDAALGDLVSVSNGVVGGPDGLPDLAIVIPNEADPAGGNGQLVILVNRGLPLGNDTFFELAPALIIELPGALNPASVSLGDLDNDKDLDIAIANRSGGTITAVINSGALGAMDVLPPISSGMARPRSVVVGDFNDDMRADVAVAGTDITGVSGKVAGLISDGLPGEFLAPQLQTIGTTLTYASLGDLDNDKDLDLVVADSGTDTVHSIENLHLTAMPWPGFQTRQTIPVGAGVEQASLDDLDNDGDLDLITVNRSGNSVSIALNDADPMGLSFGPSTNLPLGLPPLSLALADLDGDDDDDLAVIISNGQKNEQRFLRIYRNDLDQSAGQLLFAPAFDSPSDLLPLIALSDIATLQGGQPSRDIDNDGDEDVLTVNENPPSARGADASSVEALRLTCQVDLNGDMNIGSADLAILLAAWGGTGPADLDSDGVVDSADLAILLAAWGSRCGLYIDSENTR